jgi:hypothetical protein
MTILARQIRRLLWLIVSSNVLFHDRHDLSCYDEWQKSHYKFSTLNRRFTTAALSHELVTLHGKQKIFRHQPIDSYDYKDLITAI